MPGKQRATILAGFLAGTLLCGASFSIACAGGTLRSQFLRSRRVTQPGASQIMVSSGSELQGALHGSKPGDTILLRPGAVFRGSFTLPRKSDNATDYITIRSAAPDGQLPPTGARIDPNQYAAALPKIVSGTNASAALTAEAGAHHYRIIGVEFGPTPDGAGNIIVLGTGEEKSLSELPHDIEFDRDYFHGDPTVGQRRGIALNGRAIRVMNSYFADFKRKGDEAQAMCGWGGDGPFEITNNYIEAASEGVLFGGAPPAMRIVPSDITVRGNWFNKPLRWRNEGWVVKNHFELKNARRVTVQDNVMINNWTSGQDGTAVLFTVREEGGAAPQATIEDVLFSDNVVRGAGGALNIYGAEGAGGHRLTIRNNLFDDIDGPKWGGGGQFMKVTQWDGLIVEHNTILTTGNITTAYGQPVTGFVFRNNIVPQNDYGFIGDSHAPGESSLSAFFPGYDVRNNAIIGGKASDYNRPNMFPVSLREIKFKNPENGDYNLRPDSSLKGKASDHTDIGANLDPRILSTGL